MAKLSSPLLSLEARGTLGPRLTYSTRRSGAQVRFQKAQKYVASATQKIQRDFFLTATGWWSMLSPEEQAEWTSEGNNP